MELLKHELEFTEEYYTLESIVKNNNDFKSVYMSIKQFDVLPIMNVDSKFSDDEWDFRGCLNSELEQRGVFYFSKCPNEYKDILKLYVYNAITTTNDKFNTIYGKMRYVNIFFNYFKDNNILNLGRTDSKDVQNFFDELREQCQLPHYLIQKRTILDFYKFYFLKIVQEKDSSIIEACTPTKEELILESQYNEFSATPDIPKEYFDVLLSVAIRVMDNDNENIDMRAMACMIVIMSQVGLRASEMTRLKVDAIRSISLLKGEENAFFMTYTGTKRAGGNNITFQGETYINELSYKAFNHLVELHKESRTARDTQYLYCPSTVKKHMPVRGSLLARHVKRFILGYSEELKCINIAEKYPDLPTMTVEVIRKKFGIGGREIPIFQPTDIVSYVNTHQFRVHVCTELYNKQVPLAVIQHYMSHLSEDMTNHYIRKQRLSQEEYEYSKYILKTIFKDDIKPIGEGADELMAKINEFLEKENFNVEKDVDSVIEELERKIPIKQKLHGICIKSGAKRPCRMDAGTDEFFCAYGICPNDFHLYSMVDITYQGYLELQRIVQYNKENGFKRQAEREMNKLFYILKERLKPELKQLKDVVDKKGFDWIMNNEAQVVPILEKYNEIMKEVDEWLKQM